MKLLNIASALLLGGCLSACTSTYKVNHQSDTALLTVRSPQGKLVQAFTYENSSNCAGRMAMKANQKGRASKSFKIEAGSERTFTVHMHGSNAGGQSCSFTLRLDVEKEQHYVVSVVSDAGKRRCNNRLVNVNAPEARVDAKLIKVGPRSRLSNANQWCKDEKFVNISSDDGRFASALYQNTMTGNQFGVYTTSEAQEER